MANATTRSPSARKTRGMSTLPAQLANGKIRTVIVDDHEMVRRGLRDILASDEQIEVVGEAADGTLVVDLVRRVCPNVVIVDIRLPSFGGIEVTRQLKQQFPGTKVLCISSYEDGDSLAQALQAGADGFALKTISADELICAVKDVVSGESFIQRSLVKSLFRGYAYLIKKANMKDCDLSELEVEVLRLIEGGLSNREIADRFYWSDSTCKRKVQSIIDKLEARDRIQAVAIAVRRGIL